MARLRLIDEMTGDMIEPLEDRDVANFGRAEDNDIPIPSVGVQGEIDRAGRAMTFTRAQISAFGMGRTISRYHGMLAIVEGRVYIYDKKSALGTYVNGDRIENLRFLRLNDRDEITLGEGYKLKVEIDE